MGVQAVGDIDTQIQSDGGHKKEETAVLVSSCHFHLFDDES